MRQPKRGPSVELKKTMQKNTRKEASPSWFASTNGSKDLLPIRFQSPEIPDLGQWHVLLQA